MLQGGNVTGVTVQERVHRNDQDDEKTSESASDLSPRGNGQAPDEPSTQAPVAVSHDRNRIL